MIKIFDTYPQINTLFVNQSFNLAEWESYIILFARLPMDYMKKSLKALEKNRCRYCPVCWSL